MLAALLAQLVAPPLQRGPVRLPGTEGVEQRPAPADRAPAAPVELAPEEPEIEPPGPAPEQAPRAPEPVPGTGTGAIPPVSGLTVYGPGEVRAILAECSRIAEPAQRLRACAAALTARLVADGYLNSRVYQRDTPGPGRLEVVEGRIVELRVIGGGGWLNRRVARLLRPLKGSVLHLPSVERDLLLLRRQQGVGSVRGRLSRLGSDPSLASLTVALPDAGIPWQGEFTLSNDGNDGSGPGRAISTLLKPSLITGGDTLLLYGELNSTDEPDLGAVITSLSYSLPVADTVYLTGAFGYSRRNLVELPDPFDGFSSSQYQGLGQLEWVVHETLRNRWSLFAGFNYTRTNTYLNDTVLPRILPEVVRTPANGYLRLGLSGSGLGERAGWSGSAFLLQGIAAATPATQREELAAGGIEPGKATAVGGILTGSWLFAPGWQLNLRTAGQVAFEPLTGPMQFTLGSDAGLRGLPAQLISGDDGWLGTGEVVWTFWQNERHALQLVPFLGVGWIRTELPGVSFSDTVGAGGVLLRWLGGENWNVEAGWAGNFSADDNLGVWQDWALGQGLYARLQYRF